MIIPIPIPIILFWFISNRNQLSCLDLYQTNTHISLWLHIKAILTIGLPILTDYLQVLFYISANFIDTDTYIHHTNTNTDTNYPVLIHIKPIPIYLYGSISNQYRYLYRFVKPIPIPIFSIGIGIGYTDLAYYRSIPS